MKNPAMKEAMKEAVGGKVCYFKKTLHLKSNKHDDYNYPGNLVNKGEVGKYLLYINEESKLELELVEVDGKKRVRVLDATGEFAHLVEDGMHRRWYIPFTAVRNKYFIAPHWMGDEQKRWVIRALHSILRLHRLFERRVSGKGYSSKPRQYGGKGRT